MEMVPLAYANTFIYLLTNGIVSIAINDTSNVLLGLVRDVIVEHPDIKNTTDKIDLHNKLMIIDNFMKIIPKELENNKCVSVCLNSIHDIIMQIQNELSQINKVIETHQEKYFNYFRKYDYYSQLNNLINYKKILDERFETLLKIISTLNIFK